MPIIALFVALVFSPVASHHAEQPDAASALARARKVLGFERAAGRILQYSAVAAAEQNYQSDRWYPPFFSAMLQREVWFDTGNGVARVETRTLFPGASLSPPAVTIDDGMNAIAVRGERHLPISRMQAAAVRNFNPWAVLADWSSASDVRIAGTQTYRDYPRLVLERRISNGVEQLFLDVKSGVPVKLDFIEPHYLWGQRHVEYVWSTWTLQNGIMLPGAAFRLADGATETSQTTGSAQWRSRDEAGPLSRPETPADPPSDIPPFLQPAAPKPIQVSTNTWLLTNPAYTEAVTRIGDELYVFDATQGEARAALDAEAIATLFPGRHRITVVVTDLAWPHIAGLRYWVSHGARIVAHPAAGAFLERVVDRRWTLSPDAMENARARKGRGFRLNFVPVHELTGLADGAIKVAPIDGIGSEVALIVYVVADKFLWASDYIQTVTEPSLYAREVIESVRRAGFSPSRVAAEHIPLTNWQAILAAQE